MDDEISCPRCKTTKYRNPSLKLMVNSCGHALCENCVDLLFVKGSGSCPQCALPLRRVNFRFQLFENSFVEKEVDIRRRLLKDYNKKEEDFETLREYNDYLEQVETIIFNLANDIDVDEMKKKVDQYKKENQESINKNRGKKSRELEEIEDLIEKEHEWQTLRSTQANQFDEHLKLNNERKRQKEKLVDELMFSDLPAHEILETHADKQKRLELRAQQNSEQLECDRKEVQEKLRTRGATQFSTGIQLGKSSGFLPIPKPETTTKQYQYEEVVIEMAGPAVASAADLESDGYLLHVRAAERAEKAGGFLSTYPCHRALQEAFCGLYFEKTTDKAMETQ